MIHDDGRIAPRRPAATRARRALRCPEGRQYCDGGGQGCQSKEVVKESTLLPDLTRSLGLGTASSICNRTALAAATHHQRQRTGWLTARAFPPVVLAPSQTSLAERQMFSGGLRLHVVPALGGIGNRAATATARSAGLLSRMRWAPTRSETSHRPAFPRRHGASR